VRRIGNPAEHWIRLVVRHGYFSFYPRQCESILHFVRLYRQNLVAERGYFTFPALKGLPRWSQVALPYGNLPATTTYEGRDAADVLEKNGFVYSIAQSILVPIGVATAAAGYVKINRSKDYYIAPTVLVQPGIFVQGEGVLKSYSGEIDLTRQLLYIDNMEFVG
jgi:hypothetical protein